MTCLQVRGLGVSVSPDLLTLYTGANRYKPSIHPSNHSSFYLSYYLSIPFIHSSFYPSIRPTFIHPSIHSSIYLSFFKFSNHIFIFYPSIYLSLHHTLYFSLHSIHSINLLSFSTHQSYLIFFSPFHSSTYII